MSGRAVGVARLLAWKTVPGDTSRQGWGASPSPSPSPSAPPPRGDIPSIHCRGRASPRLDANTLPKSCLCPLGTATAGQSPFTARPL